MIIRVPYTETLHHLLVQLLDGLISFDVEADHRPGGHLMQPVHYVIAAVKN